MIVTAIHTPIFREKDDLLSFLMTHIPTIEERSVVVVTSKIVSLWEGRTLSNVSHGAYEHAIQTEALVIKKTKHVTLTRKDGHLMANAGIDASNGDGKYILLPKDSFKSAETIRESLKTVHNLRTLGVIISDSRTAPLRRGITGVALGYAGFSGIKSYIGTKDIFDRVFSFETTNVADCLATAAVLEMGEGNEQQPIAIIADSTAVEFKDCVDISETIIPPEDDMYV